MANITKNPKILTFENVQKIEEILGLDGIHTDGGNYILTSKDGRIIVLYECETIFSKIKEKEV